MFFNRESQIPFIIKNEIIQKIEHVIMSDLQRINFVPEQIKNKFDKLFNQINKENQIDRLVTILYDKEENNGIIIQITVNKIEYSRYDAIEKIYFFDNCVFFEYSFTDYGNPELTLFDKITYVPYVDLRQDEIKYDDAIFLEDICKCYFNDNCDFLISHYLTDDYPDIIPICHYIFMILDGIEYKKTLEQYNKNEFIKNKLNKLFTNSKNIKYQQIYQTKLIQ